MTCLLVFDDANYKNAVYGNAYTSPGWAGRRGRRAGKRPQGMAKRLTFTEGRLRLTLQKSLPDLKVRRLDSRGEVRWRRP